ncbi:hypothetical protein, conserved [Eimeria maxima]|uniref:Apple domain-containing protein n=1 Tax=Eimeria maxima TaxID=5804 RepID=U6M1Y7_EIMMA|nr:hypothetical protein, conserved [Eimeria maxima]CDJ57063.1 hypothetical protein, conserved [Eimeria maxima]
MRQLQRVAALAGLGAAMWPQGTTAWMAPNRRHHENQSGNFGAPVSMLETQWGSPYTEIAVLKTDNALDFFFSRVLGDTDADLLPIIEHEAVESGTPEDKEEFSCNLTGYVRKEEEGLHLTVRGVEAESDCQQMCGQVPQCLLATFDGAFCKMYTFVGTLEEGKGSVVFQGCDSSCYKRGKRHDGEGIILGRTPNPHVCQAMCRASKGCIGFSWEKSTKLCTSHTSEGNYKSARGFVSGPRDLCSVNTQPVDYAGSISLAEFSGNGPNDLEAKNVGSESICRRMCLSSPACTWVTYNTADFKCYLKPREGRIVHYKNGDRTSARYADSSCYLKNVKFTASAYTSVQKDYLQECVHACAMDKKCTRWSYNTQKKTCLMFNGEAPYTSDYNEANSWSGPSTGCGPEPLYLTQKDAPACSIHGVRYQGVPLSSVATATANECQAACLDATGCEAFSFDYKGKICYFYIASNTRQTITNYNFVSGPRQCAGCQESGIEYNDPIQEITNVETPENCQLLCQATAHCARYSFVANSCRLFNYEVTSKKNVLAISGPRYCTGACDLNGYFAPNKDYGYLKETEAHTKEECRALCKKDPKCSNFTHWEDRRCYLKDEESLRLVGVPEIKAATGFLTCSSCLAEGVGIKVDDSKNLLWRLEAYNGEECRWRCDIMNSCTRFVYNTLTKVCSLLKGDSVKTSAVELISGPSRCVVDNSCFFRNTTLGGGETVKRAQTETAEECQELCAISPRCTYFTFAAGQCSLLAGNLTSQEGEGWTSGPKKCFALKSLCNEKGIDYEGGELKNVTTETVEDCRQLCYNEPQCRLYTYKKTEKTCSLKSLDAVANRKKADENTLSGSKYGCARCARGGFSYRGYTITKINEIPDETSCQLQCENNSKCLAFSYFREEKICELKSKIKEIKVDTNAVSGPRRC